MGLTDIVKRLLSVEPEKRILRERVSITIGSPTYRKTVIAERDHETGIGYDTHVVVERQVDSDGTLLLEYGSRVERITDRDGKRDTISSSYEIRVVK